MMIDHPKLTHTWTRKFCHTSEIWGLMVKWLNDNVGIDGWKNFYARTHWIFI